MKLRGCILVSLILIASSCSMDSDLGSEFRITTITYDFDESEHGWEYGFADYPAAENDSAFYELQYEYTKAPGTAKDAIMLSGNNHSDDLFMYLKKKVTGLDPNRQYTLTFDVEFASEAKAGEVGAGGAPGESVYVKVGATTAEPETVIENDTYVTNFDKGNQASNGENMVVIGDIAIPASADGFEIINRTNSPYNNDNYSNPVVVNANSNGEVWFIVGTDSGFEGITTIYYTKITVVLSQVQ